MPAGGSGSSSSTSTRTCGRPSRYGVLSVPTVILFAGGEARETLVGAQGKSRYERTFAPYLDA